MAIKYMYKLVLKSELARDNGTRERLFIFGDSNVNVL